MEYMTTDACYRLAADEWGIANAGHGDRLAAMCEYFGLRSHSRLFEAFARLRNELFHQALWAGRSITGGAFQVYSWRKSFPDELFNDAQAPIWLRKLNVRLIAAVVGYGLPHTQPEWWTFGEGTFRAPGQAWERGKPCRWSG